MTWVFNPFSFGPFGGGQIPPFPTLPPVLIVPPPPSATGLVFVVPTLSNTQQIPPYRMQVTLSGIVYGLSFRWNSRAAVWTFSISAAGGALIADSIPVRNGLPLAAWAKAVAGIPPGDFWTVPVEHDASDAGQSDLGSRVLMTYLQAA